MIITYTGGLINPIYRCSFEKDERKELVKKRNITNKGNINNMCFFYIVITCIINQQVSKFNLSMKNI